MSEELKPCPCGKTPTALDLMDTRQGSKWANATCNQCGEWSIEFRTRYFALDSTDCMRQAVKYWNEAPRAQPHDP